MVPSTEVQREWGRWPIPWLPVPPVGVTRGREVICLHHWTGSSGDGSDVSVEILSLPEYYPHLYRSFLLCQSQRWWTGQGTHDPSQPGAMAWESGLGCPTSVVPCTLSCVHGCTRDQQARVSPYWLVTRRIWQATDIQNASNLPLGPWRTSQTSCQLHGYCRCNVLIHRIFSGSQTWQQRPTVPRTHYHSCWSSYDSYCVETCPWSPVDWFYCPLGEEHVHGCLQVLSHITGVEWQGIRGQWWISYPLQLNPVCKSAWRMAIAQHISARAQTTLSMGRHLIGPEPVEFYTKIQKLWEQQTLHEGLSTNLQNPIAMTGQARSIWSCAESLGIHVVGSVLTLLVSRTTRPVEHSRSSVYSLFNSNSSSISMEVEIQEQEEAGEAINGTLIGATLCMEELSLPAINETLWVGACSAGFALKWQKLPSDCRASCTLGNGVQLEWMTYPPLTCNLLSFNTRNMAKDLQMAVDMLLSNWAVKPVHKPDTKGIFSRLFPAPKKKGKFHPVLDLSHLKNHLVVPWFKMEISS